MESPISFVMFFGTIGLLVLALAIVLFFLFYTPRELKRQYQEALLRSRIEVQEQTLDYISQELHDNVGQLLSSARMLIGIAATSSITYSDYVKSADATLEEALKQMRLLTKSLSKEWLKQFDLVYNLESEVSRINSVGKTRVELNTDGTRFSFNQDLQVIVFRIVQEAINNSIKHSGASLIIIDVKANPNELLIIIKDNGSGFHHEQIPKSGLGLLNMRNRARALRGTIVWETGVNQGTSVKLSIPFSKEVKC